MGGMASWCSAVLASRGLGPRCWRIRCSAGASVRRRSSEAIDSEPCRSGFLVSAPGRSSARFLRSWSGSVRGERGRGGGFRRTARAVPSRYGGLPPRRPSRGRSCPSGLLHRPLRGWGSDWRGGLRGPMVHFGRSVRPPCSWAPRTHNPECRRTGCMWRLCVVEGPVRPGACRTAPTLVVPGTARRGRPVRPPGGASPVHVGVDRLPPHPGPRPGQGRGWGGVGPV